MLPPWPQFLAALSFWLLGSTILSHPWLLSSHIPYFIHHEILLALLTNVFRIRPLLATSVTTNRCPDMILPHLDYCNCLQNSLPDSILDSLKSMLSKAARVMLLKCKSKKKNGSQILSVLDLEPSNDSTCHSLEKPVFIWPRDPSCSALSYIFDLIFWSSPPHLLLHSHWSHLFSRTLQEHSCLKAFELVGAFFFQILT